MVELTMLLCDLKLTGDAHEDEPLLNKIEELLAEENQRNVKLKEQLKEMKDSQTKLAEKKASIEKLERQFKEVHADAKSKKE